MNKIRIYVFVLIIGFGVAGNSSTAYAYSVLSHQALIDRSWEKSIKVLLLLKFPRSTDKQLQEARAFAYGGAIMPDIGYFPLGNKFFTNLVHYVRTGDFVNALLDEADSLNEYAFALGFLCHYYADEYGHQMAINRCVPLTYPRLEKKYGEVITYAENHISHKRIEFSFDVLQTARGKYASQAYHNFIGFQVSIPVVERAFLATYGLNLNEVFPDLTLAVESLRLSVKTLFPMLTRAAWAHKRLAIIQLDPAIESTAFKFQISNSEYNREYQKTNKKPGIFAHALALFILIAPKIGPLRVFKFKQPGAEGEKLFVHSFDTVLMHYADSLRRLRSENIHLNNIDYDTGNLSRAGEYPLAEKNYGILLKKLRKKNFEHLKKDLQRNILDFYGNQASSGVVFKNKRKEKQTLEILNEIKLVKAN
ncbi:MAG TPA: zinc dependent phospholipase C family protein [Puia sp.]|nr:zinc dependent phospholipase C family protein [Puia sp.]